MRSDLISFLHSLNHIYQAPSVCPALHSTLDTRGAKENESQSHGAGAAVGTRQTALTKAQELQIIHRECHRNSEGQQLYNIISIPYQYNCLRKNFLGRGTMPAKHRARDSSHETILLYWHPRTLGDFTYVKHSIGKSQMSIRVIHTFPEKLQRSC